MSILLKNREEGKIIENMTHDDLKSLDEKKTFIELFNTDRLRQLIIGPSGCGKTHLVISLIRQALIPFTKIIVCAPKPTLEEWTWKGLKIFFDSIETKIKEESDDEDYESDEEDHDDEENDEDEEPDPIMTLKSLEEIDSVEDLSIKEAYLYIVDDFMTMSTEAKKRLLDLWVRGSKRKLHLIFLCQKANARSIPPALRDSCNVWTLFNGIGLHDFEMVCHSYFPMLDGQPMVELRKLLLSGRRNYVTLLKNEDDREKKIMMNGDKYFIIREIDDHEDQSYTSPDKETNEKPDEKGQGEQRHL